MKRRSNWLVRAYHYLFTFKLTWAGWVAIFLLVLTCLGVINTDIPIYLLFCFTAALFGVVELVGIVLRPKLRVRGSLAEKMTAGDTIVNTVTIENAGWLPALDLMCGMFRLPPALRHADADCMIRQLASGASATLPVSLHASRRGEYPLPDIIIHSTFPLNLIRFGSAVVPTRKLTVLPAYRKLEQFQIPLAHRYQAGGTLQESRRGEAPEYVGNREYVPGESVRRLDFRAWARVGQPVVREYQDEFTSRVALVLDTYEPHPVSLLGREGSLQIEAAISLTAAIADSLEEMETTIDLFAAGPDLFLFETSAGLTHFESVLEILAAVESTRHNPFEKLSPAIAESLESTSVVVCILVDWDESREDLVRRVIESGCTLRVLLVRDRPPTQPFPETEYYSHVSPVQILNGSLASL